MPTGGARAGLAAVLALGLAGCGARSALPEGDATAAPAPPSSTPRDDACTDDLLHRFGDGYHQTTNAFVLAPDSTLRLSGTFQGTIDFGGGALTQADEAFYVTKLGEHGEHVWSRAFGPFETLSDTCDHRPFVWVKPQEFRCDTVVGVDAQQGTLLVASYVNTVDFGAGPLPGGTALTRYDAEGHAMWTRLFTADGVQPRRPVSDAAGNIVVAGQFVGQLAYDGVTLGAPREQTSGFVVAIAPDGALRWSKVIAATALPSMLTARTSVAAAFVDPAGVVTLTGRIEDEGQVDFGAGVVEWPASEQAFVARYDMNGGIMSVVHVDAAPEPGLVAMGANGELAVVENLGDDGLAVKRISTEGQVDVVCSFEDAKAFPTTLDLDPGGRLAVGGYFAAPVDFGAGTLVASGEYGIFTLELDAAGNVARTRGFGGPGLVGSTPLGLDFGASPLGVAHGDCGSTWLAGSFAGTLEVDGQTIDAAGEWIQEDVFLTRLAP